MLFFVLGQTSSIIICRIIMYSFVDTSVYSVGIAINGGLMKVVKSSKGIVHVVVVKTYSHSNIDWNSQLRTIKLTLLVPWGLTICFSWVCIIFVLWCICPRHCLDTHVSFFTFIREFESTKPMCVETKSRLHPISSCSCPAGNPHVYHSALML